MHNVLFVAEFKSSEDLPHVISGFILVQVLLCNDIIKKLSTIQTAGEEQNNRINGQVITPLFTSLCVTFALP